MNEEVKELKIKKISFEIEGLISVKAEINEEGLSAFMAELFTSSRAKSRGQEVLERLKKEYNL